MADSEKIDSRDFDQQLTEYVRNLAQALRASVNETVEEKWPSLSVEKRSRIKELLLSPQAFGRAKNSTTVQPIEEVMKEEIQAIIAERD